MNYIHKYKYIYMLLLKKLEEMFLSILFIKSIIHSNSNPTKFNCKSIKLILFNYTRRSK